MFNQQVNPYALLGAEMAQQASAQNQVRKAMEPKSDQVVARAKTIMGMISPASPMSGFPGQAPMPPQNPFAQGMGMPQSPMGMPPQVPGFANGGQVDSNSLMSAVFGKSPDALFKALMGRDLAGSTTQDIADYQQKLQGYGAGDALNKETWYGAGNKGDVYNSAGRMDLLSRLLAGGAATQSSGGTGQSSFGGQTTDAYGRNLADIPDGERTVVSNPGDQFSYGYGPEWNFMYTGGKDAKNYQVQDRSPSVSSGYYYGLYNPFTQGYADGGQVQDGMQDYTSRGMIPDANDPQALLDAAQLSAQLRGDSDEYQRLEMMKRLLQRDPDAPAEKRGYADGGQVKQSRDGQNYEILMGIKKDLENEMKLGFRYGGGDFDKAWLPQKIETLNKVGAALDSSPIEREKLVKALSYGAGRPEDDPRRPGYTSEGRSDPRYLKDSYFIDKNVLSEYPNPALNNYNYMLQPGYSDGGVVNRVPHNYQSGGHVQGPGTEKSDSILARLSNNEFVIPAEVVRKIGAGSADEGGKVLQHTINILRSQ